MIGSLLRGLRLFVKRFVYDGLRRDRWQDPERIVHALGLAPGQRVADLGSGTGYFTLRLARGVGPDGVVYAVDTDEELLAEIARRAVAAGLPNVLTVQAGDEDVTLPEPVDLVFVSHVYHHLPDPAVYLGRLAGSLRDGGRIAILEGRPTGRISRWFGHVTEPAIVRDEMASAGFRLVAEHPVRREESFQVFERN